MANSFINLILSLNPALPLQLWAGEASGAGCAAERQASVPTGPAAAPWSLGGGGLRARGLATVILAHLSISLAFVAEFHFAARSARPSALLIWLLLPTFDLHRPSFCNRPLLPPWDPPASFCRATSVRGSHIHPHSLTLCVTGRPGTMPEMQALT